MGLYPIDCNSCGKPFMWFSGTLDQRCQECVEKSNALPPMKVFRQDAEGVEVQIEFKEVKRGDRFRFDGEYSLYPLQVARCDAFQDCNGTWTLESEPWNG